MTRRRLVISGGILLLVIAAACFLSGVGRGPVTEANAARIRSGQTLVEVRALLGTEANGQASAAKPWLVFAQPAVLLVWSFHSNGLAYETGLVESADGVDVGPWLTPESRVKFWLGRGGAIQVRFDDEDRVVKAKFLPARLSPTYQPDTWSTLKRWWHEHFTAEPPSGVP